MTRTSHDLGRIAFSTAVQAAESRRSIRKFADAPIPESDLRELLRLAGRAPSAFNAQPWRFLLVTDGTLKSRLAAAAFGQPQIACAPATIVVYSDMADALARIPEAMHPDLPSSEREAGVAKFRAYFRDRTDEEREAWGNAQANIALGYLLLLAESMGYGTSPMLGFEASKIKRLFGMPTHVQITALVAIGIAAEQGHEPHRLEVDSLVAAR